MTTENDLKVVDENIHGIMLHQFSSCVDMIISSFYFSRISLVGGLFWLFVGLANSVFYFMAFGIKEGSKVRHDT